MSFRAKTWYLHSWKHQRYHGHMTNLCQNMFQWHCLFTAPTREMFSTLEENFCFSARPCDFRICKFETSTLDSACVTQSLCTTESKRMIFCYPYLPYSPPLTAVYLYIYHSLYLAPFSNAALDPKSEFCSYHFSLTSYCSASIKQIPIEFMCMT